MSDGCGVLSAGSLWKTPPLPPHPHHPGRRSAGVWKAAAATPPPGTLPHPLENATRFPQPTGPRDDEGRREEGCTVLIVAAAQE
jgi:hypothetical protein